MKRKLLSVLIAAVAMSGGILLYQAQGDPDDAKPAAKPETKPAKAEKK